MQLDKTTLEKAVKTAVAILAAVIGIAAGYGASTLVLDENSTEVNYCQSLEGELQAQYNESSVICHEPGWVALSSMTEEVENKTDLRCACTRINDGQLTIFPIRAATD